MAIINIKVDEQEKTLYMDGKLHRSIESKVKVKVHKKDFDWVWVVDGPEGSGKSVFAMQLGKVLDPDLSLDRICMTPDEFTKAIIRAKKGQCVIYDEAMTGLSSRASLTEINRLLVSLMMEMRSKNLFVIIVMPTFFLLDRYVALFRARGLFHVYIKNGARGRWVYFNNKKKKLLYLIGRKLFNYSTPKSKFRGRFYECYTVNEEDYRNKKTDALMKKSRSTKAQVYKAQRDTLFWIINKKLGKNQVQIAKLCEESGFKIKRNTISEIIMERNKDFIRESVEEDENSPKQA